jgi:hypothetical protein
MRSLPKIQPMRLLLVLLGLLISFSSLRAQKMLVLERANRAKTTKLYIGESLRFRLTGRENYWYNRSITDMIPESNTLLLDNFPVKLGDIGRIKVQRKGIWRITGGALLTFGATLALATTVGRVFYQDKDVDAPKLFAISALSFGGGWLISRPRKLKMGAKHRLRIIEIKFPDPIIPPPPVKQ